MKRLYFLVIVVTLSIMFCFNASAATVGITYIPTAVQNTTGDKPFSFLAKGGLEMGGGMNMWIEASMISGGSYTTPTETVLRSTYYPITAGLGYTFPVVDFFSIYGGIGYTLALAGTETFFFTPAAGGGTMQLPLIAGGYSYEYGIEYDVSNSLGFTLSKKHIALSNTSNPNNDIDFVAIGIIFAFH